MQRRALSRRRLTAVLGLSAALVLMLGLVSACGASDDRTIALPGPAGERSAIVYHPSSAGPGAPLVIVSHGANGSAEQARKSFGWDALAERYGFVVAYPDALDGRWNAGFCCRKSSSPKVDDVAFLHELRDRLIAEDDVDPRRVFAVGASNGGMLSYAWACTRPGDLAGIGIVAGALTVRCPDPAPLTVVAVHGAQDEVVPVDGGPSVGGPGNNLVYPSIDEALAPFIRAADCSAEPQVQSIPPATVTTWPCPKGREVVRDVIDGEDHGWPGSGGDAGATTEPWDSTGFLWSRLGNVEAPSAG
jgi:polyhydroxybutyrate depolymerase